MAKSFVRRALLTLTVLALLVSVVCLTVAAKSYDFSQVSHLYNSASPADGGWEIVGHQDVTYNFVESSTGFQDAASRYGGVLEEIQAIYYIPETEQVYIKDFNEIAFNRRLSNGELVSHIHGASYDVILTMDDGQTITRNYPWFDPAKGIGEGNYEVVDKDIEKDIEALEGNPKLAKITYVPYHDADFFDVHGTRLYQPAVEDDPETPDVDESQPAIVGGIYYFLVKHFDLNKTA